MKWKQIKCKLNSMEHVTLCYKVGDEWSSMNKFFVQLPVCQHRSVSYQK